MLFSAPVRSTFLCFFFFNDTATTEIYTLSLHDALPICDDRRADTRVVAMSEHLDARVAGRLRRRRRAVAGGVVRSEEHTSELQSRSDLVCRLLLEKKNKLQHRCCADINYGPTLLPLQAR